MELSVLVGVNFCGFPNASDLFFIGISIWALWKNPPTSDSAADSTTWRSVFHSINITPFLKNMSLVCGVFVR